VQQIFPTIPSIQAWKWRCKMEFCDIRPYQNVWWLEFYSNKKWLRLTSKGKQGSGESIPKINDISSNPSSMKVHEFGDSTSSASSRNDAPITIKKKELGSQKIEVPYKSMKWENPKKNWKDKNKIKFDYLSQCQSIFIESGTTGHGAFFKQHLKFDIVFFESSDGTKRIELHKGGNIKPKVLMKKL